MKFLALRKFIQIYKLMFKIQDQARNQNSYNRVKIIYSL